MTKGQWEDDDLYGEGSDLGDDDLEDEDLEDEGDEPSEPPPPPAPAPAPRPVTPPQSSGVRPIVRPAQNGPKRRLKVKPMAAGMRTKWPDVTTVLLTLSNGQQVMFVR